MAEISDVSPFGSARKLAALGRAHPTVRGSDRVAHYGHIAKMHVRAEWVRRTHGRCVMAVVGGLDLHRGQLTFDYMDLGTGGVVAGRSRRQTGSMRT
jgi:hypothetical protein